jgi:predicted esterase
MICVQWWLGSGEAPTSYYTPQQIYREIDLVLKKLGAQTNSVMLHGFSRGSANSYAVVALDAGRGKHYFSLAVASSGGVGLDYPPTRAILDGSYGEHPLKGTRWVTAAGAHDPHPDRDGIAGMKRAAAWLKEQDATVLESIEDPDGGHGALQRNPKNAKRVLDLFLNEKR